MVGKKVFISVSDDEFKHNLRAMLYNPSLPYGAESTYMATYILDRSGMFEDGIPDQVLLEATNALIRCMNILFEEREKVNDTSA
jgi:hypothetical protein